MYSHLVIEVCVYETVMACNQAHVTVWKPPMGKITSGGGYGHTRPDLALV